MSAARRRAARWARRLGSYGSPPATPAHSTTQRTPTSGRWRSRSHVLRSPTRPEYMAWLHTVLRHEALAVARTRRRESPGMEIDVAETVADGVADHMALDALAEWRERYRSIQDGLAGLTEAQRTCLILQSAGASYERIGEVTGYSRRKVERSVLEGRASLRSWEVRLASGEVCERMGPAIDRVAQGEATARERRSVTRHVRHCGPCRALLRDRRESSEWLANLVPIALITGEAFLRTPDPSPALAWWDRIATGTTVRAGSVVQVMLELPSSALAKVGAGTAAVAVAGAAGAPLLIDTVARPAVPEPSVAALQGPATSTTAGVVAPPRASPRSAPMLPSPRSPPRAVRRRPPWRPGGPESPDRRRSPSRSGPTRSRRRPRRGRRRAWRSPPPRHLRSRRPRPLRHRPHPRSQSSSARDPPSPLRGRPRRRRARDRPRSRRGGGGRPVPGGRRTMGCDSSVLGDAAGGWAIPDPGARAQPGRRRQPVGDELGVPRRRQRDPRRAVRGAPHPGPQLARADRDRQPADPLVGGRRHHPPLA